MKAGDLIVQNLLVCRLLGANSCCQTTLLQDPVLRPVLVGKMVFFFFFFLRLMCSSSSTAAKQRLCFEGCGWQARKGWHDYSDQRFTRRPKKRFDQKRHVHHLQCKLVSAVRIWRSATNLLNNLHWPFFLMELDGQIVLNIHLLDSIRQKMPIVWSTSLPHTKTNIKDLGKTKCDRQTFEHAIRLRFPG